MPMHRRAESGGAGPLKPTLKLLTHHHTHGIAMHARLKFVDMGKQYRTMDGLVSYETTLEQVLAKMPHN